MQDVEERPVGHERARLCQRARRRHRHGRGRSRLRAVLVDGDEPLVQHRRDLQAFLLEHLRGQGGLHLVEAASVGQDHRHRQFAAEVGQIHRRPAVAGRVSRALGEVVHQRHGHGFSVRAGERRRRGRCGVERALPRGFQVQGVDQDQPRRRVQDPGGDEPGDAGAGPLRHPGVDLRPGGLGGQPVVDLAHSGTEVACQHVEEGLSPGRAEQTRFPRVPAASRRYSSAVNAARDCVAPAIACRSTAARPTLERATATSVPCAAPPPEVSLPQAVRPATPRRARMFRRVGTRLRRERRVVRCLPPAGHRNTTV